MSKHTIMPDSRIVVIAVLIAAAASSAFPAAADVARLRNGRTLEVIGHRLEGSQVVLLIPGGGEVALPTGQVLEIRRGPGLPSPEALVAPAPSAAPAAGPGAAPEVGASAAPAPPVTAAAEEQGDDGEVSLPVGGVFDRLVLETLAERLARRHGVDEALVRAVILVESRYDAFAVSPRGAMGLMQLMPLTAVRFEVRNAFDPIENVDAGVRYLKELLARYSGETRLALAAYNAGEAAVERYGGVPPYRETTQYVRRVLREIGR